MIETIAQAKRRVRDAKIQSYYKDLKTDDNLKSAVVEEISRKLKVSITTVNRVIK